LYACGVSILRKAPEHAAPVVSRRLGVIDMPATKQTV